MNPYRDAVRYLHKIRKEDLGGALDRTHEQYVFLISMFYVYSDDKESRIIKPLAVMTSKQIVENEDHVLHSEFVRMFLEDKTCRDNDYVYEVSSGGNIHVKDWDAGVWAQWMHEMKPLKATHQKQVIDAANKKKNFVSKTIKTNGPLL